jgi:hypothetical protein
MDTALHLFYVLSGINAPDAGNQLQVIDVSNRSAPVILGSCASTFADSEYRVAKSGTTLYCAGDDLSSTLANQNLLQVFDVSNSAAPAPLTTYNTRTGFASDNGISTEAQARGTTLYISGTDPPNGKGLLGIYNVTNPLAVTQTSVTTIANTGIANDITLALFDVVGNYAFFMLRTGSLGPQVEVQAWDISNPALPTLASAVVVPATNTLRFSQVSSGHTYGVSVSPANQDVFAVNCTNPLALANDGTTVLPVLSRNFSCRAVNLAGPKVYIARAPALNSRALFVFDATVPGALVQLGSVTYTLVGSLQQLHLDI